MQFLVLEFDLALLIAGILGVHRWMKISMSPSLCPSASLSVSVCVLVFALKLIKANK